MLHRHFAMLDLETADWHG